MLTWQLDRFLRSGPLCAIATFVIPFTLAFVVNAISEIENVLGIMLVASGIIFIGSLVGSSVTSGLGVLLFGLGTVLAEISPWILLGVSCALFATLMLHDLAGSFRRAPSINAAVWRDTAMVTAAVCALAIVAFAVSYLVGSLAAWQTIVVPFGIAAVGFGAKLAADSHVAETRQLTAKRKRDE